MKLEHVPCAALSIHVIRRLPRYLRELDVLLAKGITRISSVQLGRRMGLTASQIRQDFSCCSGVGIQGYGYNVAVLRDRLAQILGMDRDYSAILIGAGKLGRLLMESFSTVARGYHLRAVFDADAALIGQVIDDMPILSISNLRSYIRKNGIDIAILAVPTGEAQRIADAVTDAGIRGIWNFTNTDISTGESQVPVEDVHFSDSFLTLSYFLAQDDRASAKR